MLHLLICICGIILESGNTSHSIMAHDPFHGSMILLMSCWICFARIMLRIPASMIIRDIACNFLCLNYSLLAWLSEQCWLCKSTFRSDSSFSRFWKRVRRTGDHSCLNVWWDAPVKPSGAGFGLGRFLCLTRAGSAWLGLGLTVVRRGKWAQQHESSLCFDGWRFYCLNKIESNALIFQFWENVEELYLFKKNITNHHTLSWEWEYMLCNLASPAFRRVLDKLHFYRIFN